jgi:hypothetical protein
MRAIPARAALFLVVLGLAAQTVTAQEQSGWEKLYEERGITVSTRAQTGQQFPSFRGQARLRGELLHVLSVVLDDARTKEWAKSADEASVLRKLDERTQLVYSRSHQTWPVRDRDLVMKRRVEVRKPGEAYRVHIVCVAGEKPPVPNVIRIKQCETEFLLRKSGEGFTFVDYQVRADPGGNNPDWMVRWASKSIPFDTLVGLEKQVAKTKGQYDDTIRYWQSAK